MNIPVLFESDEVLVLDKPAHLSVHGDGKREEYTLADYITENFPKIVGVGEDVELNGVKVSRPGIVHRLDKDTSGCILIAKTGQAYNHLKSQFQNHEIKKEYIGLVYGWIKNDSGIIDLPLARSKADFRKQDTALNKKGGVTHRGEEREAMTRYKVLERKIIEYIDKDGNELEQKVSLVAFFPTTGRMHQIRVHSKSINHPIVADRLYARQNLELEKAIFGDSTLRQLLHARKITFFDINNNQISVEAPVPKEFAQIPNLC